MENYNVIIIINIIVLFLVLIIMIHPEGNTVILEVLSELKTDFCPPQQQ